VVESDTAPNIKINIDIELLKVEMNENISLKAQELTYIHINKSKDSDAG
jgi:hypothetical protein